MRTLLGALLLSGALLLAQDSASPNANPQDSKDSKGQVTLQGCVSRASGDFILIRQDPAVTYELQGTRKIKLSRYIGQHVEVTGNESPTMATSSDAMRRSASPVTLNVTSIRTIDKECSAQPVSAQ
jgi:hypothetical protein